MISSKLPPRIMTVLPQLCAIAGYATKPHNTWTQEDGEFTLSVFSSPDDDLDGAPPTHVIRQEKLEKLQKQAATRYEKHPALVAVSNNLAAGVHAVARADDALTQAHALSEGAFAFQRSGEPLSPILQELFGISEEQRQFNEQQKLKFTREIKAQETNIAAAREVVDAQREKLSSYLSKVLQALENTSGDMKKLNTALARFKDNPFAKVLLFGVGAYLASRLLPSPADISMSGAEGMAT